MAIGLCILGLISILIFFGVGERYLRKAGIANWLAFLIVALLAVGILFPNFSVGIVSINVGGFIAPIIAMLIFFFAIKDGLSVLKAIIAIIFVAVATAVVGMLVAPSSLGLSIAMSVIIGFTSGAVAYLVGRDRLCSLIGVVGGITLGDLSFQLIKRYFVDGRTLELGTVEIFNAIIIGMLFAVIFVEAIGGLTRLKSSKSIYRYSDIESSEDLTGIEIPVELMGKEESSKNTSKKSDEFIDYFDDTKN